MTKMPSTVTTDMSEVMLGNWRELVYERLGFVLPSAQLGWLKNAIAKTAQCEALSIDALYARVVWDDALFWRFAEALLILETRFFRDESSVEYVCECYLAHIERWGDRAILNPFVVVSAGCATGQEAWSLAMALHGVYELPCYRVFGVDASAQGIECAERGVYDKWDYKTHERFNSAVDLCCDGIRIADHVRAQVAFFQGNLIDDPITHILKTQGLNHADMIVCQNVIIYFDKACQELVLDDFARNLGATGQILLGSGEGLFWTHKQMQKMRHPRVNIWQCRA